MDYIWISVECRGRVNECGTQMEETLAIGEQMDHCRLGQRESQGNWSGQKRTESLVSSSLEESSREVGLCKTCESRPHQCHVGRRQDGASDQENAHSPCSIRSTWSAPAEGVDISCNLEQDAAPYSSLGQAADACCSVRSWSGRRCLFETPGRARRGQLQRSIASVDGAMISDYAAWLEDHTSAIEQAGAQGNDVSL